MATGVYSIQNLENGKVYVGSSARSIVKRWEEHRKALRKGAHHSIYLQRAWDIHGENAFLFKILEECPRELCVVREQYWIDLLESANREKGYNVCPEAGSCSGRQHKEGAFTARSASAQYHENLKAGIRQRNASAQYRKNLKRANQLVNLNGSAKTIRGLQALKQHKERGTL